VNGGEPYLAIVNPAAGGGRGREILSSALERLRTGGVKVDVVETRSAGDATRLAREAYGRGQRRFIAVGGDGTSYEVVNGLFPEAGAGINSAGKAGEGARPTLGFLPLGTGNSFLRDFSDRGVEHAIESLIAGRTQACDVLRLRHRGGVIHYINLLSVGFPADVANLRARRFRGQGELGYLVSIFLGLARLQRRPFPVRVDGETEFDRRRCLFLTFNNSKFTGGTMMIAPKAEVNSGRIEYVRWGAIGRLGLIRNLPKLYDGTHIEHRMAERKAVTRVAFDLDAPVDLMVDGEVLTLHCEELDVLPGALDVVA
jgi:YegS/Rv2252/BmrU family lipid kinase